MPITTLYIVLDIYILLGSLLSRFIERFSVVPYVTTAVSCYIYCSNEAEF
jgi:ACR3 family arsenite efflux pump ArsB